MVGVPWESMASVNLNSTTGRRFGQERLLRAYEAHGTVKPPGRSDSRYLHANQVIHASTTTLIYDLLLQAWSRVEWASISLEE